MKYLYLLRKDSEITAHLIRRGIEKDLSKTVNKELKEFCFETAKSGNVELMQQIIARHPTITAEINNHRDETGHTILDVATNSSMINFLIIYGALRSDTIDRYLGEHHESTSAPHSEVSQGPIRIYAYHHPHKTGELGDLDWLS